MIKSFRQFNEDNDKEVFFTFGRFNPPTTGHQKLLDKIASVAKGNDYKVFASTSNDPKKNPLEYKEKVRFMRKMYPKHARSIVMNNKVNNALQIASELYKAGYNKITMVVGGDRVKEFDTLLKKYNDKKARHGYYNFVSGISVVSAGERDPDAEGVTGMSASKMRAAATDGDFKSFQNGLPKGYSGGVELFNTLRKRMGLKEMSDFREHIQLDTIDDMRERYSRGELFNVGDTARNKDGKLVTIAERKPNYIVSKIGKKYWIQDLTENKVKTIKVGEDAVATDKPVHYALVKDRKVVETGTKDKMLELCTKEGGRVWKTAKVKGDIVEARQDSDIKDKKGTQPAKYYSGLSKSTKSKRDAHFKKGAKKDDDDPSAYKPAPGDARAKTKPSKHTKKFKAMFGEEDNPRIPRKKGQPANSDKHSDLYTDENPKGTIKGLGFKDVETAEASIKKIENSGKSHAHKIQAAIAMEQRARVMKKTGPAAVYRKYINKMKKKTKEKNEDYDKDFKPHIMYDPKTGKAYKANTLDQHLKMSDMGYVNKKPTDIEEADGCWDGFKKVGMKKKGNKMVPNCVPEEFQLDEKLITFAKKAYPKAGNVVILAGGAGSGKGFVLDNLVGIEGKVFDVDALKSLVLKAPKVDQKIKDEFGVSLNKLNLTKPNDVAKLHQIVGDIMNLPNKKQSAFFAAALTAAPEDKPNIIFDVTLKDLRKLDNITRLVQQAGYDKKKTHIVWVVNDIEVAKKQNLDPKRGRVVPIEILVNTHRGASQTMLDIIKMGKGLKKYMDGDIVFAFNKINVDSDLVVGKKGGEYLKRAEYFYAKRSGEAALSLDKINKNVLNKISDYVPNADTWSVKEGLQSFKDVEGPYGLRGTDELTKKYKKMTPGYTEYQEKLDPRKHDVGDYIDDFMKSDAPQFKGKSKEKIRKMAIAAYLDAKEEAGITEGKGGKPESFEAQFKRRVVKTTKPEHKEKGYKWRIKGKDRPEHTIKLYKVKPGFEEFKKQLRRVAGHEFGG
jgi:hypothetical protein